MDRAGQSRTWWLRPARLEDAAPVVELWQVAEAEPTATNDPESVRALLVRDPGALVVAEADGRIVGSLVAGWDGWRGHLYRLAVHPGYRRRGLGAALVAEAEQRLRSLGARRVNALVVRRDERAVAFWGSAGYPLDDDLGRHVKTM